jgi:hypothetical protein
VLALPGPRMVCTASFFEQIPPSVLLVFRATRLDRTADRILAAASNAARLHAFIDLLFSRMWRPES